MTTKTMTKYVFAAVAAASMLTAATATADTPSRSVRIAAVNYEGGVAASVDVAVSAGAESISLYTVHGASDQGANIGAWDHIDPVAVVPASEVEQTFTYNLRYPRDAFYRFMLATFSPPFKKQLAFLKSTGSQYFVLGDKCPNQDWRVLADVSFNKLASGASEGFWGARKAARDSAFLCLSQGGAAIRFDMAGGTPLWAGSKDIKFQIDESNHGVSIVTAHNGSMETVKVSHDSFTSPCPMALFAVNSNGSPTALNPGTMTLYSFKVWTNRTDEASLIYNLVPCVKNDDTVTFYNRVDGSFLPVTSGTFGYNEADVVAPTVGDSTVAACSELLAVDKHILAASIVRRNNVLTTNLSLMPGLGTNKVVVAYGAADGGENPAHWDNCAMLGIAAPEATSFSSALPFDWTNSVRCARFFTVGASDTVGDKLLRPSGTQYIVTDYTPTGRTKLGARLAFIDTGASTTVMWSGRESAGTKSFNMLLLNTNNLRFDYDNKIGNNMFIVPAEGLTLHTASMGGALCALDGTEKTITGATVTDFTAGAPLTFFAMNTADTISSISCVAFAEVKVWSDFEDSSSLILHLLPAVQDGQCGFRDILEGGKFYPNSAASGDDFEVIYPNLNVHSVSEPISSSAGTGTAIYLI